MGRLARSFAALALAAVFAGMTLPAFAASLCLSNGDCPTTPLGGGRSCTKQKIFGVDMFWGLCSAAGACNTGADCIPQAECRDGFCQRPAGTCVIDGDCGNQERCVAQRCESTTPPGKGTGIPGEGRHCIPPDGSKPNSWAEDKFGKPLGACPQGTRCNNNGICVRLET